MNTDPATAPVSDTLFDEDPFAPPVRRPPTRVADLLPASPDTPTRAWLGPGGTAVLVVGPGPSAGRANAAVHAVPGSRRDDTVHPPRWVVPVCPDLVRFVVAHDVAVHPDLRPVLAAHEPARPAATTTAREPAPAIDPLADPWEVAAARHAARRAATTTTTPPVGADTAVGTAVPATHGQPATVAVGVVASHADGLCQVRATTWTAALTDDLKRITGARFSTTLGC